MHHPRAQGPEPGLGLRAAGAVGVDVLQGLAHPAGPGGLEPLFLQAALGLQLEFGQAGLVPGPQVFRAFEQRVVPALGLSDPVDGACQVVCVWGVFYR